MNEDIIFTKSQFAYIFTLDYIDFDRQHRDMIDRRDRPEGARSMNERLLTAIAVGATVAVAGLVASALTLLMLEKRNRT
ncbi:hypothetical protein COO72_00420 [Bifidobacterium callitrichos]|nr:hypothetical protein COO72_00420 [Bifidobacterium callitrichos]